MLKYIVVREYIDPDKEPRVIGNFSDREDAETYASMTIGKCWVFEMSK